MGSLDVASDPAFNSKLELELALRAGTKLML